MHHLMRGGCTVGRKQALESMHLLAVSGLSELIDRDDFRAALSRAGGWVTDCRPLRRMEVTRSHLKHLKQRDYIMHDGPLSSLQDGFQLPWLDVSGAAGRWLA